MQRLTGRVYVCVKRAKSYHIKTLPVGVFNMYQKNRVYDVLCFEYQYPLTLITDYLLVREVVYSPALCIIDYSITQGK